MEFDYDDFESSFAAHERITVAHKAGAPLTECETNLLEQEVFDHDPVSLVVNFDWSEDDALEECYGYYEGIGRYDIEDCIESLGWIETGIYPGDTEVKENLLSKLEAELEKAD